LLDATVDAAQVSAWWQRWPNANIAVVCGARSGFFVLDIDPKNRGDRSILDLQQKYGRLPDTVTVHTGSGGWHFYYKHVPGIPNRVEELAEGVDTRADDKGYVVAPPSVHPNGTAYQWAQGRAPHEIEVAEAPEWLLNALRTVRPNGTALPADYWRSLWLAGAASGNRNQVVTRIAGHLIRKHIDPIMALDIIQTWNQQRIKPPLPSDEVEKIVNSICGKELARIVKRRGVR